MLIDWLCTTVLLNMHPYTTLDLDVSFPMTQLMVTTKPEMRYPVPKNPLRRAAFGFIQTKAFELAMLIIIFLDIGTMFLSHQGQSWRWFRALEISNLGGSVGWLGSWIGCRDGTHLTSMILFFPFIR